MKSVGFKAVAYEDASVLVLGSLPGKTSLEKREYYAQARNAFWPIMGDLVGASPQLAYAERLLCLKKNGIALWDVCAAAERAGSLDSEIRFGTVEPNDFLEFFEIHRHIRLICFNGARAALLYERKVLSDLPDEIQAIPRKILPSTSPAHAGMPFKQKLFRWRAVIRDSLSNT